MSCGSHSDTKGFATLQAKAAIAGWQVVAMPDGSFVVSRWTLTRSLADLAALTKFLREVGAA